MTQWSIEETDAVGGQEGVAQRSRKVNAGAAAATLLASDASGNVRFDGRFVYQYDALGRLVQVNQKGSCVVNASGQLTGTPGPWVLHRTYDGLGRLIRVQAPWPSAELAPGGWIVSRRYCYDGDRRIARVSTQPYSTQGVNLGDPGRIKGEIDLEQELSWLSRVDRLWVWDPSDTDKLVAVYGDSPDNTTPPTSPLTRAWLAVTDHDGTPVALLDHSTGSVVARSEFEPAGGVLAFTTSAAPDGVYPPQLEVGWKGLFAERLDRPLSDWVLQPDDGSSSHTTGTGPALVYDVRARVYRPWLGRFLQQDPLGMGVPVRTSLRWHGKGPWVAPPDGFNSSTHHRDGQHAMAFAKGRSIGQGDPTGLLIDLLGPTTTFDLWTNQTQNTLEWSNSIRGYASNIIGDYAFAQEMDMDWASDWSYGDDEYSRFALESENYDTNHLGAPASIDDQEARCGTVGILRGGLCATKNIGKRVYGTARGQLHHLVPKFLGGEGGATAGLWAVGSKAHAEFHALLDRRLLEELNICRATGTAEISRLINNGSIDVQRMRRILIEVTKSIENAYPSAAGMTKELMREIRRQQ